jgi:hypothetical protein
MQRDGSTTLITACEEGHAGIVTLLLAAPSLNVNAAKVSCVSWKHVLAVISHCYARCKPEVWQEGWVRGRVSLELDCVGCGL